MSFANDLFGDIDFLITGMRYCALNEWSTVLNGSIDDSFLV